MADEGSLSSTTSNMEQAEGEITTSQDKEVQVSITEILIGH